MKKIGFAMLSAIVASAGVANAQNVVPPGAKIVEYEKGDTVVSKCLGCTRVVEVPNGGDVFKSYNGLGRVGLKLDLAGTLGGGNFATLDGAWALGLTVVFRLGDEGRWNLGVRLAEGQFGSFMAPALPGGFPSLQHDHTAQIAVVHEWDNWSVGPVFRFSNRGGLLEPSWGFLAVGGAEFGIRLARRFEAVITPFIGAQGLANNHDGFNTVFAVEVDAAIRLTLF